MVTPGLANRISRLKTATERLRKYTSKPLEKLREEDILPALEREIQVTIQALLDVGEHIVAESGWQAPQSYRDLARILAQHGVIGIKEAEILAQLAWLRNILVHIYAEIDEEKIYNFAKTLVKDAETLAKKMLQYMEKAGIDP